MRIYIEIANRISFALKEGKKFDDAFAEIMRNYRNLDWATTRREIGSILGNRKRRQRKKIPEQQDLIFFEMSRAVAVRDATLHEASLMHGIPEHDL